MCWVRDHVPLYTDGLLVVELGSRDVNGSVRSLFTGSDYVGVDMLTGDGVDVVCDAAMFSMRRCADVVVSTEMLEHTGLAAAADVMRNVSNLLCKDGKLILTCAGPNRVPHSAIDGLTLRPGEKYSNIRPELMRDWLRGWRVVKVELHRGDMDLYVSAVK